MRTIRFAFATLLAALALPVAAQTLYKLIDKNGKVTYSEEKPKNFDGQVIRIDVDPKANTMTLPKPEAAKKGDESASTVKRTTAPRNTAKADAEARVEQARAKYESAQKAFEAARDNPGADDVQFIGNKGGGTRAVPSDEYQQKLAQLEKAVKDAEEELKRAEKDL
jgi:uncharacterized protein DUF4124